MLNSFRSRNALLFLSLLASLLFLAGCSDKDKKTTPSPTAQVSALEGQVVNPRIAGSPAVAGATVRIGDRTTTTDSSGFFILENVNVPASGKWLVSASKQDFNVAHRIVNVVSGAASHHLTLPITNYDARSSIDPTQPNTISSGNITLELPANAVNGATAGAFAYLTWGDPNTEEGRQMFPGDYFATNDANQTPSILLESIGFIDISVRNADGLVDLTELSEPAKVTVKLPPQFQTGGAQSDRYVAGDSIPWWSYNPNLGTWVREDADTSTPEMDDALVVDIAGELFAEAEITHFSWWNLDQPIDTHACVRVRVVDELGNPIANQSVTVEGRSYDSSYTVETNNQGYASLGVKRSANASNPETFILYSTAKSRKFRYNVTSAAEGNIETDVLFSPTQLGSVITGEGSCVNLENTIEVAFAGTINGRVVNSLEQGVAGLRVFTTIGVGATTGSDGRFTLKVPHNTPLFVVIPDAFFSSDKIETNSGTPIRTLDPILFNPLPSARITANTNMQGLSPNGSATLTAIASDPQGQTLSYAWTASSGTLSANSGSSVNWTAPSTSSGTATITLTVSAGSRQVQRTIEARWNDGVVSSEFKVTVRPFPGLSNADVEGIKVILHSVDGAVVDETVLTNAQGVASFGTRSGARVSYTVIDEISVGGLSMPTASTWLSVPNKPAYTWSLRGDPTLLEECDAPETYTEISASLSNVPEGTQTIEVFGDNYNDTYEYDSVPPNGTLNIRVCNTMLAAGYPLYARAADVQGSSLGNSLLTFPGNESPPTLSFNLAQREQSITVINESGPDELSFELLGRAYPGYAIDLRAQLQDNQLLFDDLQTDYYFTVTGMLENGVYFEQTMPQSVNDDLPAAWVVRLPEFAVQNGVNYNTNTRKISWTTTAPEAVKSVQVNLQRWTDESTLVTWDITAKGDVQEITLPSLPEELWALDLLSSSFIDNRTLSLQAADGVLSFDDLYDQANAFIQTAESVSDLDYMWMFGKYTELAYPIEIEGETELQ